MAAAVATAREAGDFDDWRLVSPAARTSTVRPPLVHAADRRNFVAKKIVSGL